MKPDPNNISDSDVQIIKTLFLKGPVKLRSSAIITALAVGSYLLYIVFSNFDDMLQIISGSFHKLP